MITWGEIEKTEKGELHYLGKWQEYIAHISTCECERDTAWSVRRWAVMHSQRGPLASGFANTTIDAEQMCWQIIYHFSGLARQEKRQAQPSRLSVDEREPDWIASDLD